MPGRKSEENDAAWHLRKDSGDKLRAAAEAVASSAGRAAPKAAAPAAAPAERERRTLLLGDAVAPAPQAPAPVDAVVTAGVVDDNADFGAYLAYRQRNTPAAGARA